jgi:hypothetical protein
VPVPEQQKALQRIRTLRVEGLSPRNQCRSRGAADDR